MATYSPQPVSHEDQQSTEEESGSGVSLLSFPWVADRILAHIKQAATEDREKLGKSRMHVETVIVIAA